MPTIDPTKTHQTLEHKHDRPLTACRYDPTGRFVFFGAEDNLVHRFEIATKKVTPLAAHDSWVRAIGFSPDGKIVYTGGYDGRLIAWPAAAETPTPIFTVEAHRGWLRALAVRPDGKQIVTCGNDNLVKRWNPADGELIDELAVHDCQIYNVAFSSSGDSLAWCDLKGVMKEWDAAQDKLRLDLGPAAALYKYDTSFRADIGGARCMTYNTDGSLLAVGGITNVTNAFAGIGNIVVVVFNLADGKLAVELQAKDKINGSAWGLAHHPEKFWIALAGGGGGGWLYFFKDDTPTASDKIPPDKNVTANEFFKLKLPSDGRDMSLSPDKTQVAVAHADKSLRIYSLFA